MSLIRGLTTTGKPKTKQKFRSAADAKRARELEQDWTALKTKWGVSSSKSKTVAVELPTIVKSAIRTSERGKSLNSWTVGAVSSKKTQQYTGDKMVGIGTLHKSNAVPVFSGEEAQDIARMRRG
jgi:hypothetical protein